MYLVIQPYSQVRGTLCCLRTKISTLRIVTGRYYLCIGLTKQRKNKKTYQCIKVLRFNLEKSYYILKHAYPSILPCIYYIILC
jgi:hypothetical protein